VDFEIFFQRRYAQDRLAGILPTGIEGSCLSLSISAKSGRYLFALRPLDTGYTSFLNACEIAGLVIVQAKLFAAS
jgi:hypothetical protein